MDASTNILCTVDFSDSTDECCQLAADLCRSTGARAILCHVTNSISTWREMDGQATAEYTSDNEIVEKANSPLERMAKRYFEGINTERHVVLGKPAETIIKCAQKYSCSMIVIGRPRLGVSAWLRPSAVTTLMSNSPVPILILGNKSNKTDEADLSAMSHLS